MAEPTVEEWTEMYRNAFIAYDERVKILADRYIGQASLLHLKVAPDAWSKKTWYLSHIKRLSENIGQLDMLMRRCRNGVNSQRYQRYFSEEKDLRLLVEELTLSLLALK